MKKSRILGYALTLAATLMVGSAMGQDVLGGNNYVELKDIHGATAGTETASLVEMNTANGFFAKPSDWHASYNKASNYVIVKGFTWVWSVLKSPGAGVVSIPTPVAATGDPSTAGTYEAANYVELTFPDAGRYTLNVKERAPAALGGCADPVGVHFNVYAFAKPSYSLIAGVGSPTYVLADKSNISAPVCVSADYQATVQFQINAIGTPHVKYRIDKYPVTIDPSTGNKTLGTAVAGTAVEEKFGTTWDWNQAVNTEVALHATNDSRGIKITAAADTTGGTTKLATYNFSIKQTLTAPTAAEKIVAYRFFIEGVNGLLTRKGLLTQKTATKPGTYSYVANATDQYVDIYLVKAPKTGPVYHISNNVAK